jgi:hypothetical protein
MISSELVQAQSIRVTAQLVQVARADHGAVRRGGGERAEIDGVVAVALLAVLGAEVLEALAEIRTLLERHVGAVQPLGVQGADAVREVGLAAHEGVVADDDGIVGFAVRRVLVQLQPVAGTAVLERVAGAGHVAVGQVRGGRRRIGRVAAVAFAAELRAEVLVALAEVCAGFERHADGRGCRFHRQGADVVGQICPAAHEGVGPDGGQVREG